MAQLGKFQNLDFEQGAAYWKLDAGATIQTATPRSGSKYLQIASSGAGFTNAYAAADQAGTNQQYLPVVPGQIVQCGGWAYRSVGTGNSYTGVAWYDSSKTLISQSYVVVGAGSGAWAFYSHMAKAPANAAFVSLYAQVDNTATTIFFDDLYVALGLDVQTTTGGAVTDQTAYLSYQSLTLKFNTFDFQLVNPTVVPNLGDIITAADPNLALSWSGIVAKIQKTSVSEKGGNTYVVISATNTNVAVASVAPFDLSDGSQPLRNWVLDGPMQDATLAALENSYTLGTPAEFSLDTVNFHDGAQSLHETTTRLSGWNTIVPNMPGGHTPTGAYSGAGQVFAVAPGMTYSLSLWVKALAGSKQNHIKVLWFKDTASNLSDINTTTFVVGGTDGPFGWVQWTGTATAPQDARYAMIQVMAGYWDGVTGSNGQFWCQDLTWGGYARFREASHSYSKDQGGTNKTSSSYLTQATGLWPLQTVAITNADLGLVNADYSVTEVALSWDIDHVTPWQRVTVGDPVVTMSVWLNSTNAGILPITTTKISDGAVTTPKVAANAITAAQIAAGAITADKLTATLVLASLIKAGSGVAHVEMDQNGLRAYDGSGNLVVNIPTDGVSPVTINANVLAKSLVVSGNSVFDGAKNEIALGATLQLDSSLQNPAQAPSVAQSWAGVTLPINSTYDNNGTTTYNRVGLDYDAAGGSGGTTKVFYQVTQNGGAKHDYMLELLASDRTVNRTIDLTTSGFQTPLSVCRLGSYVYVLGIDGGTGAPSNWGATGSGSYSYDFTGSGSDNQISTASGYVAPGNGTITSMTIRCAGYGQNCGFYFCVWDSGGNLVANSSYTTLGSSLGDQTLSLSYRVTGGSTYYFGFWADRTGSKQWGVDSSGSFDYQTNLSGPSSLGGRAGCTGPYVCGNMRAFVTYTPDTRVWKVRRYVQSTLALDTTYASISQLAAPTTPVMCQDGTNLLIVDRASGGTMKYQKYDGSLNTVGSLVDTGVNPGNAVTAAAAGTFDIGAWRLFIATTGNELYDFDGTTPTPVNETANEGFSVPNSAAVGLAYGDALGTGARFWSCPVLGGAAVNLTEHSTWTWTTASSVYWVAYTWYDNQVGHVHETMASPYASITLSRRAQLVITAPAIPGTGGLDDPNAINFYALPNASQPGIGAAKQQASQSAVTLTMTGYNASGAADPSTNNFPSGSAAVLQPEIAGWSFKGDGTYTNRFRASGYRSAAFTATALAWQIMPMDTVLYDPNSNYDIVTHKGRYTAPVKGVYDCRGAIGDPGATGQRLIVSLFVNGTEVARGTDLSPAGSNVFCQGVVAADLYLNAGDYVELGFYPSAALNFNGRYQVYSSFRYVGDNA